MPPRNTRAQQIKREHWPEIERAYLAGAPYTKIANELSVSPITVAKWLREEGLRHKGKRGRYPSAMHGKTRELYRRGWTIEELSDRLDVPEDRIEAWLKTKPKKDTRRREKNPAPKNSQLSRRAQRLLAEERGRRHKPRTEWTEEQERYVIGLIKKKLTVLEVYRVAGASKARQSKIWRKYGNKGPPPNFPSQVEEKKRKQAVRRARREPLEEEVRDLRDELRQTREQLKSERRRRRSRSVESRRRAAEIQPVEQQVSESPRRQLPPTRRTALPPAPDEET